LDDGGKSGDVNGSNGSVRTLWSQSNSNSSSLDSTAAETVPVTSLVVLGNDVVLFFLLLLDKVILGRLTGRFVFNTVPAAVATAGTAASTCSTVRSRFRVALLFRLVEDFLIEGCLVVVVVLLLVFLSVGDVVTAV
jgi:hypothetical protein